MSTDTKEGRKRTEIPASAWAHQLHPIFRRCLDPEMIRYDLSRPFVVEEYVYATNARIAVRMPVPDYWTIPNPEGRVPDGLLLDLFNRGRWRADPTQFPPVTGECAVCKGARVMPEVDCPWCRALSPGPYEAGCCDECWQLEGKIPAGPCHDCWGSGVLDADERIEVTPGYWLQRKYVAMLHEFEMSTYLPRVFGKMVGARYVGNPTRFTLGDITGLVMPMSQPDAGEQPEASRSS